MLIYVTKELDNDWHQFLMILTNDQILIEEMKTNRKGGKDKLVDFFESIAFQVMEKDQ